MAKHLETGLRGERYAVDFLLKKGYKILERNWRHKKAEIDIIAMDGDILVFVEVKTRSSDLWGEPADFVTTRKMELMTDAMGAYMDKIDHDWEVRFDIIGVILHQNRHHELQHFEDAFFPGLEGFG